MALRKIFTGLLVAGSLLVPGAAASAADPLSDEVAKSVAAEVSQGNVLVLTPEEMQAEGVGSPEEFDLQMEAINSLTDEQQETQAELRAEVDSGLAAAGISRGEPAELVGSSVATDDGVISPFIWSPACWTSGDYYQVRTTANGGTTHCYANAGSMSFNRTFAWDNVLVSVRPGNNRGYVLYQLNGVYYNSVTRGPDYGTYYFGEVIGSGNYFFGVTIY